METKLIIVVVLSILWIHTIQSFVTIPPLGRRFNCRRDVPPQPLMLEPMAGTWYEIGRAPDENVSKCLNVSIPSRADDKLKLQLEYIATYDDSNRPTKEEVSFPWDNFTKNSVFHLYYGFLGADEIPTVTYKVIYTDHRFITIICGYSAVAPMPLFKILSKKRILDQKIVDIIEKYVRKSKFKHYFMWTDQINCNVADCSVAGMISLIPLVVLICRLFNCS